MNDDQDNKTLFLSGQGSLTADLAQENMWHESPGNFYRDKKEKKSSDQDMSSYLHCS